MPTYQRSNSSTRRPFGSVNANTLRAGLGKSSGSANGDALKPVKEKKSLLSRGLFTSILTKKAGKTERCGTDETLQLESPAKKARVDTCAAEQKQSDNACAGDDRNAIFHQSDRKSEEDVGNFWSEEMEEMLTLKLANAINESRDDESLDVEIDDSEERDMCDFYEQVRDAMVKDISVDETGSSFRTELLAEGYLKEHESDGYQLMESPAKKARVETKPSASGTTPYACDNIFRPSCYLSDDDSKKFWSEDMKDMLSLKPSRAINKSCDEDETSLDNQVDESKKQFGSDFYQQTRAALVKVLSVDGTSSTENRALLSEGNLKEHADGVQLHFLLRQS